MRFSRIKSKLLFLILNKGGKELNRKKIIITFLCIAIICIVFIYENNPQTPYEFLVKKSIHADIQTRPSEMVYQVKDDSGEYLLFYINERGALACAIIEKGLFSYRVVKISSQILLTSSEKPVDFIFSSYQKGKAWIEWGIIRDKTVDKVLIDGKEAAIIDTQTMRICYISGKENEKTPSMTYQLYDKQGQLISN